MKKPFASLALTVVVAPVWAATQPVILFVSDMTCLACPVTVKKAISKVDGASKIAVTFETRETVVTFDDVKTSVQKLTRTTGDAGYPSSVKQWATKPDPRAVMRLTTRIAGKAGVPGSMVSVMGCAACFPAIASPGVVTGLDFLREYKGLFIFTLLPLFAAVALLANALDWLSYRQ